MLILIEDLIKYICLFLSESDKINYLSISRNMHLLKNTIQYFDKISINKIIKLSYYKQFTNIIWVDNIIIPNNSLPLNLAHLTFGRNFNQDIKGALPLNLTHLTFHGCFNQDIKGALPLNLTNLTFGYNFNKDIKGALPLNLTH